MAQVCDYFEALDSFFVHTMYCSLEYDSDFELPDCDNDQYCTANLDSLEPECQASAEALRPGFAKSEEVSRLV